MLFPKKSRWHCFVAADLLLPVDEQFGELDDSSAGIFSILGFPFELLAIPSSFVESAIAAPHSLPSIGQHLAVDDAVDEQLQGAPSLWSRMARAADAAASQRGCPLVDEGSQN